MYCLFFHDSTFFPSCKEFFFSLPFSLRPRCDFFPTFRRNAPRAGVRLATVLPAAILPAAGVRRAERSYHIFSAASRWGYHIFSFLSAVGSPLVRGSSDFPAGGSLVGFRVSRRAGLFSRGGFVCPVAAVLPLAPRVVRPSAFLIFLPAARVRAAPVRGTSEQDRHVPSHGRGCPARRGYSPSYRARVCNAFRFVAWCATGVSRFFFHSPRESAARQVFSPTPLAAGGGYRPRDMLPRRSRN